MAVLTGLNAQGYQRYREASRAAQTTMPKARVTTRTFGLSLGRFGLSYTQRDLHLDPDAESEDLSRFRSQQTETSFARDMEVETLRQRAQAYQASSDSPTQADLQSGPNILRRGLEAYRTMASGPAAPVRRTLLGIV